MKNEVSNDFQEINDNTINCIFVDVCPYQEVTINEIVPSSLVSDVVPSPSDDEVPLSSLLSPGFKMKKGVKSQKSETKKRLIQGPKINKTMDYILIIVCTWLLEYQSNRYFLYLICVQMIFLSLFWFTWYLALVMHPYVCMWWTMRTWLMSEMNTPYLS